MGTSVAGNQGGTTSGTEGTLGGTYIGGITVGKGLTVNGGKMEGGTNGAA
jgi:hypothetical protein